MSKVFIDLDSLVQDVVTFKFGGSEYKLRPITARAFMQYCNAIDRVQGLYKKEEITEDEIVSTYQDIVQSVCPDFPKEKVIDMTRLQISALLQMILDFTKGEIASNPDVEKKKTMTIH